MLYLVLLSVKVLQLSCSSRSPRLFLSFCIFMWTSTQKRNLIRILIGNTFDIFTNTIGVNRHLYSIESSIPRKWYMPLFVRSLFTKSYWNQVIVSKWMFSMIHWIYQYFYFWCFVITVITIFNFYFLLVADIWKYEWFF